MFLDQVRKTIHRYDLIEQEDSLVIGISGGPDSVTLLYALNGLKKEFKLKLYPCHFDHMLRADSIDDRKFCEALCFKMKLPIITGSADVAKMIQDGGSTEEIARQARFRFFFSTARKVKAKKIALGHNLDDQAETVLMRIIRGAGLYGISGIMPKRNMHGFLIIRPLIEIRRKQITAFLRKKRIASRTDPSNLTDLYLRNRLRNNLLPLLKAEYNPKIEFALSNLAESASLDYDYLVKQSQKQIKRFGKKIPIKDFLRLHRSIQRLVLRLSIEDLSGSMRRITSVHIREIEDMILNRPANSIVDLPSKIFAVKKQGYFTFSAKT